MNPINPIILRLGQFEIRWYGVLIMAGVALGAYFAARLAPRRGENPDHAWGALILAVDRGSKANHSHRPKREQPQSVV